MFFSRLRITLLFLTFFSSQRLTILMFLFFLLHRLRIPVYYLLPGHTTPTLFTSTLAFFVIISMVIKFWQLVLHLLISHFGYSVPSPRNLIIHKSSRYCRFFFRQRLPLLILAFFSSQELTA